MGVGVAEEEAIEYSAGRKPRNSSHLTSRFGALSSNALMGVAGQFADRSTEVVSFPRKRNPAKTFSTALAFDQRVDARLGEHEANGHRPTTPIWLGRRDNMPEWWTIVGYSYKIRPVFLDQLQRQSSTVSRG